ENGHGILYEGSGHLTGAEIIAAKRELLANEARVRQLTFGIVSLVDVTDFLITLDDIRELARIDEQLARLTPRAAVAVVAPRDHDFGMARMWQAVAEVPGWS